MDPRLTVLTLGVDDLERSVAFYCDGLGWPTAGIIGSEFEHGAVCFFDLAGGVKLALWPRTSLAKDAGLAADPPARTELSLGHNVRSAAEVDEAYERAIAAGATAIRAPHATFWGGYSAYIADPDRHLWELVFNPDLVPG